MINYDVKLKVQLQKYLDQIDLLLDRGVFVTLIKNDFGNSCYLIPGGKLVHNVAGAQYVVPAAVESLIEAVRFYKIQPQLDDATALMMVIARLAQILDNPREYFPNYKSNLR